MSATHLNQLVCACLLTACLSANAETPVFVAANVLRMVTNREKEWTAPRTTLALSAGQASDCASYARLRASGIVDDGSNERVKSEYLICDVLIQLGPTPEAKALPVDGYGVALASRLDLRSFPSSLGPMVDEERYTLARLFEGQVRTESDGAAVKTPDMVFSLTIVAVGDVDHSGKPDWIVWVSDEVVAGTYRGYETLLIKDPAPDGPLRAQSL